MGHTKTAAEREYESELKRLERQSETEYRQVLNSWNKWVRETSDKKEKLKNWKIR
jgi:hypothetical protein